MEAQAGLIDQLDALWLEAEIFGEVAPRLLTLQAVAVLLAVALMPSAAVSAVGGVAVVLTARLRDVRERDAVHRDDEAVKGLREILADAIG